VTTSTSGPIETDSPTSTDRPLGPGTATGRRRALPEAIRAPFSDPALRVPTIVGLIGAVVAVAAGTLIRPGGAPTLLYPLTGRFMVWGDRTLVVVVSLCGVGALLAAWVAVFTAVRRRYHERNPVPVSTAVGLWLVWALPFALGPALFSRDIFSYAGQGETVAQGFDPSMLGVRVLGPSNEFLALVDPVWRGTPCPYGPFWLWISSAFASLSGHQPLVSVLMFRILALASVAVSVWCLIRLARHYGGDVATVVVLAVGNPIVMLHAVSGAHNEALMMALILIGMVLAVEGYLIPGVVACALAASIKIPAFAAVVFLGWAAAGPGSTLARRLWSTAWVSAVGGAVVALVSVVSGRGFGWLGALQSAGGARSLVAPARVAGIAAADVLGWIGIDLYDADVKRATTLLGLGLAAALSALILLRTKDRVPFVSLGLALLVVSLLGPALYPWYVLPAFAVMALTLRESRMWLIIVLSVIGCVITFPSGTTALYRVGGLGPWIVPAITLGGLIFWYRTLRPRGDAADEPADLEPSAAPGPFG